MKNCQIESAPGAEPISVADRLKLGGLPPNFTWLPGGIYQDVADEETEPSWLCSRFTVVARFRDSSGRGWGRILEVEDPDGMPQRISLLDKDLETRPGAVRGDLASLGLQMQRGPRSREALIRLIRECKPTRVMTSTDRIGWADESCAAFVQSDGHVLGIGDFHFNGPKLDNAKEGNPMRGSVEDWRDSVASLCVGNPLLAVSVSLAFAGPLLEFLNEEGGGIHLRGASSCGKTTIQRVATSVWRNPSRVGSWRTTSNALEVTAKAANSTLLSLDEIAEISGRHLDEVTYMLANGVGKVRANARGSAAQPAAWRVAILSTGEISVSDKLAEAGVKIMAGQNIRLIDLEADSSRFGAFDLLHGFASGAEFSDRLKRATAVNYGTAGPAFVEWLIRNRTEVRRVVGGILDGLVGRWRQALSIDDDAQVLRVARRLGVIALAGELAGRAGLTGWKTGEARDAAKVALDLWLDGRGATLTNSGQAAKERTCAYILANEAGFAEPCSAGEKKDPGIHGWKTGDLFLISGHAWHAIHGSEATQAARDLKMAGLLVPGEKDNLARKAPRWVDGRPGYYTVRAQIIGNRVPVDPVTSV